MSRTRRLDPARPRYSARSRQLTTAMTGRNPGRYSQRRRVGPMLPAGMPSMALISAYGMGGSSISRTSSRWQHDGVTQEKHRPATVQADRDRGVVHLPGGDGGSG